MHLFQIVCRVLFTQYKGICEYLNNRYTKYQLSTGCWLSQNSNYSFAWSMTVYNRTIYILQQKTCNVIVLKNLFIQSIGKVLSYL